MNTKNLRIDPACLGRKMLLTAVSPYYEYNGKMRTDTVLGYRYEVALPECGYDKMSIKIPGTALMEQPDAAIPVEFADLQIGLYAKDNNVYLTATATGIQPIRKQG